MKQVILSAKNLCKVFPGNTSVEPILNHIDVDIYQGDFTVIMGPSGAGKSTLLYALSGMDGITGGVVEYQGHTISGMGESQMAALRTEEFGFIFQQTHLVSNLTLFENVVVAGYLNHARSTRETERCAEKLLSRMNVEKAKDRLPCQTSGGEAQRASIARAMINRPGLIFADEPTGALNRKNTDEVLKILTQINQEGQSILMVTHDLRAAIRGTRLLYLDDGKILAEISLSHFSESQVREREATVSKWLASLSW